MSERTNSYKKFEFGRNEMSRIAIFVCLVGWEIWNFAGSVTAMPYDPSFGQSRGRGSAYQQQQNTRHQQKMQLLQMGIVPGLDDDDTLLLPLLPFPGGHQTHHFVRHTNSPSVGAVHRLHTTMRTSAGSGPTSGGSGPKDNTTEQQQRCCKLGLKMAKIQLPCDTADHVIWLQQQQQGQQGQQQQQKQVLRQSRKCSGSNLRSELETCCHRRIEYLEKLRRCRSLDGARKNERQQCKQSVKSEYSEN